MKVVFVCVVILSTFNFAKPPWCSANRLSKVEKSICADYKLSQLDDRLNQLYNRLNTNLPKEQKNLLKKTEDNWLRKRNKVCRLGSVKCIEKQYKHRIYVLEKDYSPLMSKDMEDKSPINDTFNFHKNTTNGKKPSAEPTISNTFTFSKNKTSKTKQAQKEVPNTKTIIASGYGINKEKALKNAFKSAVQQYVGVLVDADTVVKNDKLIKDEVLTASNGYIKSYDEISTENEDGLVSVKIKAVVESQKVFDKVKSLNIATVQISGTKNIYAKVVSKQTAKVDAQKMLKKALKDFWSKESIKEMLAVGINDVKVDENVNSNNKVSVNVSGVLKVDYKIYAQKVEKLEQTFKGLGAKLHKRADLLSETGGRLEATNRKKINAFCQGNNIGIIKKYGKGYKLDVWEFPSEWSNIYPFNIKQKNISWKNFYNIMVEIKGTDGIVLSAKDITRSLKLNKILLVSSRYYRDLTLRVTFDRDKWEMSKKYFNAIWPFFCGKYRSCNYKQEVPFSSSLIIDVEDTKKLGSVTVELN